MIAKVEQSLAQFSQLRPDPLQEFVIDEESSDKLPQDSEIKHDLIFYPPPPKKRFVNTGVLPLPPPPRELP